MTDGNVLRRPEAGASWQNQGLRLEDKHISSLLWEPERNVIFAGVHEGLLYRSVLGLADLGLS